MNFIPTGGVCRANLISHLKLRNVPACGGSRIIKRELIAALCFGEIRTLTADAVRSVQTLPRDL